MFNYAVDRTASEKINDFMSWAEDIKNEIMYTRAATDNSVKSLFIRLWYIRISVSF